MSAKKTPCDECRERKRRCSYDKPCQRCIKFNLPCVYTVKTSPADEEYLRQIKLLDQVDQLHVQLDALQQELVSLQLTSPPAYPSPLTEDVSSPLTSTTNETTFSTNSLFSDYTKITTTTNNNNNNNNNNNKANNNDTRIIKRQRTRQGLEAIVCQETPTSWTLTVSKGNVIIRTDIHTYTELLDYFCKSVSSVEMNNMIPTGVHDYTVHRKDLLSSILQAFVWKRYGKSRYKTITYGYHHGSPTTNDIEPSPQQQLQDVVTITLGLLQAYLTCCHLDHLAIHVPTFLNHFVHLNVMESPAVLALCAVACTSSCRHVSHSLSSSSSSSVASYGRFYFDQARDLAMDQFDQPSLEIFTTFVLMAFYKLLIQQIEDSRRYGDMADRMASILVEQQHMDTGQQVLFKRLEMQLFRILSITHITKHHHHRQHPINRRVLNLFHGVSDLLLPVPDDTDQEKRHILLTTYIHQLNKECHNTAHQAPAEDTTNYVGIVGHMVEMAMRRWYAGLPDSFRLDIPLFDAFSPTKWSMAIHSATDIIPFLATMTVYNEYMMMAKAHICKHPDELGIRESLATYWRSNQGNIDRDYISTRYGQKWVTRLEKLEDMMKKKWMDRYYDNKAQGLDDDDGDDDDDDGDQDVVVSTLLESGYAGFDDPAAHISVTVAINTIQLLQYLKVVYPCHYSQRVALNTWHILLRATRFGFGDQDVIHANLLCCLEMVRDEFNNRIPYKDLLKNYVATMEQELDELYSVK